MHKDYRDTPPPQKKEKKSSAISLSQFIGVHLEAARVLFTILTIASFPMFSLVPFLIGPHLAKTYLPRASTWQQWEGSRGRRLGTAQNGRINKTTRAMCKPICF